MVITQEMAENLIKFYDEHEKEVYDTFVNSVDLPKITDFTNQLFLKRFGIHYEDYLQWNKRTRTSDFLFGFFLGVASEKLIKEKVEE